MIPYSAAMEAKLIDMEEVSCAPRLTGPRLTGPRHAAHRPPPAPSLQAEKTEFLTANEGIKPMMDKIVVEGYHTLQLIHFYTCGSDEVKCWTIKNGWKAPQAAGTIHTDFERGFIKAEVYSYADWKANDCDVEKLKAAGRYRTEGKEYVVKDGDIIFFKFNVTADAKKK